MGCSRRAVFVCMREKFTIIAALRVVRMRIKYRYKAVGVAATCDTDQQSQWLFTVYSRAVVRPRFKEIRTDL